MQFIRILFVDDEPNSLDAIRRMLHDHRTLWDMRFVRSVEEALTELRRQEFDTVVSDVSMPGGDGFELLAAMRADEQLRHIPVIMLTGLHEGTLKLSALEMGAADLLSKPVQREELLARVRSALLLKSYHDESRAQNATLKRAVADRTRELEGSRFDIIWCLARAAEERDGTTGSHIVRVAGYSRIIAQAMSLDHEFVEMLTLASPLHDVGKLGIPDEVLQKPGPLSATERATMQQHCAIGAQILNPDASSAKLFRVWQDGTQALDVSERASNDELANPLLEMASTVALTHHERWDGGGYPQGLAGEDIPLEARIVALADVYDALRSQRSYKPPFTEARTRDLIREEAGAHFDPEVHVAFEGSSSEFGAIADQFADGGTSSVAAA